MEGLAIPALTATILIKVTTWTKLIIEHLALKWFKKEIDLGDVGIKMLNGKVDPSGFIPMAIGFVWAFVWNTLRIPEGDPFVFMAVAESSAVLCVSAFIGFNLLTKTKILGGAGERFAKKPVL